MGSSPTVESREALLFILVPEALDQLLSRRFSPVITLLRWLVGNVAWQELCQSLLALLVDFEEAYTNCPTATNTEC